MKIAISGAGVAGPTLAYWLLQGGHEPMLIEKAPALRTGGYVIDFWGVGYEVASRMGLEDKIRQAGYEVGEIRLVGDDGRKRASLDASSYGRLTKGRFISLPRGDLARIIYETVENRIETMFGESIAQINEHGDGVRLSFEKAGDAEVDLVIGADGLHSNVRRLVFGAQDGFDHELGYRVVAYEVDGYAPRDEFVYVMHADPGRQAGRFSLRGGRTLILFVWRAELGARQIPHEEVAQKQEVRDVFADMKWECPAMLEAMDGASNFYFDKVSQIRLDNWTRGRVALIGDAAACVSLLAGEGTGLGMTEAYVLAGELAKAGGGHAAAFNAYETKLRGFLAQKQKSAEAFAPSFAPKTGLGVWLRVQAVRLMSIPLFTDMFLGPSIRDDFDLPDYQWPAG